MTRLTTLAMTAVLAAGCGGSVGTTGDAGSDTSADTVVDTTADTTVDTAADTLTDVPPPECEAMDARAVGECAAIVPGVTWTGNACVALGSGCGCEGTDCDAVYDTLEDCVNARFDCYDHDCSPMEVADDMCVDCTGPMFLGAFWSGMECFELRGCACTGDGCHRAFASVPECELVQDTCEAHLCQETGGTWYPSQMCGPCGHYTCGLPPPEDCCDEGCDCGPGRSFDPATGCFDDDCTPSQNCTATGGTWYPLEECRCEFFCGEEVLCSDCMEACDCGEFRVFDPDQGCLFDADRCGEPDEEALCTGTGGRWAEGEGCGHFTCGQPNLTDTCVMPGCDCGLWANFQTGVGCVPDEDCVMPAEGDACIGHGFASSCRPGLSCCEHCGVAPGCPTCDPPCCDDSPACQDDGCFPPPP